MRLMYSGRDFAWIYERQDQVSFLDGHVRAFAHFGGVPARVAYDNLKAAVVRILVGGERTLTARFTALASHYLVEPCFCRPGEGHDKGGVESRGKAVRRQALTPIPSAPTLEAINQALLARMDARLAMGRDGAGETIGARFATEAAAWRPLPVPFVAEATTFVDRLAAGAGAARGRGVLRAVSLGRPRSRRARGRDDRHDRRARRHAHPAPAEALRRAVDRLPPLSAGAGEEAAGGAAGAPGAAPRSRRPVSRGVGALPRGASRSRGRAALCEGAGPDRGAGAAPTWRAPSRRALATRHPAAARGDGADPAPRRRSTSRRRCATSTCASGCAADYDGWLTAVTA